MEQYSRTYELPHQMGVLIREFLGYDHWPGMSRGKDFLYLRKLPILLRKLFGSKIRKNKWVLFWPYFFAPKEPKKTQKPQKSDSCLKTTFERFWGSNWLLRVLWASFRNVFFRNYLKTIKFRNFFYFLRNSLKSDKCENLNITVSSPTLYPWNIGVRSR